MNRIIACTGLSVALVLIGFSLSFAKPNVSADTTNQPFQVTVRVFNADQSSPIAEHVVMFDGGTVFSVPKGSEEPITMINESENRVVLLDKNAGVHTTISTTDLLTMTARLRSSASSDVLKDRLGINAKVTSDDHGSYSVAYGNVQYTTTTQKPAAREFASRFGRFADWATRLNIAQQRGLPPFGRMLLSSTIAADGRIPLETKLTFQQDKTTHQYHSTHQVDAEISATGRAEILKVVSLMERSKEVPLNEFPN